MRSASLPPPPKFTVIYGCRTDKVTSGLNLTTFGRGATGGKNLSNQSFQKLFSPEETNDLIPRLELLIGEMQVALKTLRSQVASLAVNDDRLVNLTLPEIIERYPELRGPGEAMAEAVSQIESLGCFLKDVDQGLVDFPFDNGGEVAFLCWQSGEPSLIAWHSIEGGFSGRQPLPGAAKPYLH